MQEQEINNEEEEVPEKADAYVIHIDNFDGPLDILWGLIKKAKIDITEISISSITEQYIEFLKMMENLNVRIASEFIWMASELLYYKSKALLPSAEMEDEYFTPPLPPELIQKLLEYKKYQQAAADLRNEFDVQANAYSRSDDLSSLGEDEEYLEVSLFDLLKAFADVLESQTTVEREEIVFDEILVSDRIDFIAGLLKEKEVILFVEIFSKRPKREEIVASFLAILEMAKTKMVKLFQYTAFGDIRIGRNFSLEQLS
ncbi:MAG: segregation/condensation protein A [bacterium]|nr:segregation/condensation protein A [bacterium]